MQAHRKLCCKIISLVGFFRSSNDPHKEICSLYEIFPKTVILPLSARFVLIFTESLQHLLTSSSQHMVSVILLNCPVPSSSSGFPYCADYAKLWMENSFSGFIKEIT